MFFWRWPLWRWPLGASALALAPWRWPLALAPWRWPLALASGAGPPLLQTLPRGPPQGPPRDPRGFQANPGDTLQGKEVIKKHRKTDCKSFQILGHVESK